LDYRPVPIETSGVKLSEDLRDLTELLARNAHDNWARQRLSEGWRYGPERNDARKDHPCLVVFQKSFAP
jgi:RyR domain